MNETFEPSQWKYISPEVEGFHEVIAPQNSPCKASWFFRLNLAKGKKHQLLNRNLELNAALVKGAAKIHFNNQSDILNKLDSFYLPANQAVVLEALENVVIYIGGGLYEGKGSFFTRKFDSALPLGNIRQVHGQDPYRRDVFMTLAQQDEASRLICGITMGDEGKWTSWPPHQHTKDLEEIYIYFDIPSPKTAFHFASRKPGKVEYVHPVSDGHAVVIPEGYHPTCGMPGVKSCYFWIMAAHSPASRRYDLAINDPHF